MFHLLFINLSTGSLFKLEALDENGKVATIFIASGHVSFAVKEPRGRQICGNERERSGRKGGRREREEGRRKGVGGREVEGSVALMCLGSRRVTGSFSFSFFSPSSFLPLPFVVVALALFFSSSF